MALTLSPSTVPSDQNYDCRESSFFQHHLQLPTPDEVRIRVRQQLESQTCLDVRRQHLIGSYGRKPPASWSDLNLFVKWGPIDRTLPEALCLFSIYKILGKRVPVPEVYGWRTDGDDTFIYMELVRGVTLESVWEQMDVKNRRVVCEDLREIIRSLRTLQQDPRDKYIGNILRNHIYDRSVECYTEQCGPFLSVKAFHDWYAFLCRQAFPDKCIDVPIEPYRYDLPDDTPIRFTHGDLHQSNIMVSSSTPYRVITLIDWEQSGWLPEYWENCKTLWTSYSSSDWAREYVPLFLEQNEKILDAWRWYESSI
ncbi:phosphotransferase enzyme family protein [Pseudovirgaria hyperparasitica]|uniref:Phosphotransferase enzyme family protein n=1 Tax=Pseudovirgaria hyperparasitica TaxID=470096 RepID=A0A6A6WAP9_9PEZI|nr:phosphotransferase enzyme family protein [Pseudovirgaria hyperparasitica]KAF2759114.1 phosphotransferase enzyme family protein [Pseudovirgaria hyperparasitica]